MQVQTAQATIGNVTFQDTWRQPRANSCSLPFSATMNPDQNGNGMYGAGPAVTDGGAARKSSEGMQRPAPAAAIGTNPAMSKVIEEVLYSDVSIAKPAARMGTELTSTRLE